MFDKHDSNRGEQVRLSSSSFHSNQHLEDAIFSLTHRISSLESNLSSKIDRTECMHLLESKPTHSHLKKITEQINIRMAEEVQKSEERSTKSQKQNEETIKKMIQKLKNKKDSSMVKPQQLYLESNETMFSMVVDQIVELKQGQTQFEKSLEHRHRINLSLNNEVCAKLDKLEKTFTSTGSLRQMDSEPVIRPSIVQHQTKKKIAPKTNLKKTTPSRFCNMKDSDQMINELSSVNNIEHYAEGSSDSVRFGHLQRIIQSLQKQLGEKISIKDLTPIIKKNMEQLYDRVEELRVYSEEAIESTKKILVHQSEINQELCVISKIGWWQSFQQSDNLAIWNKQIANMLPEAFMFDKDSNQIILAQQGNYLIKVVCAETCSEDDEPTYIYLGQNQIQFNKEILLHLNKSQSLKIPSNGGEMLLIVHKL